MNGAPAYEGQFSNFLPFECVTTKTVLSHSSEVGRIKHKYHAVPQPLHGEHLSRDINADIDRAFFFLVNGPKFHKGRPNSSSTTDCLKLLAKGWEVEITATYAVDRSEELAMESEGRYASHYGEIRREDGVAFSLRNLQDSGLLDCLFWFLSFVRGAHCGIPVVLGGYDIIASPILVADCRSTRRRGIESWYSHMTVDKQELKEAFRNLTEKITGGDDELRLRIAAYLENNASDAALELKAAFSFSTLNAQIVNAGNKLLEKSIQSVWSGDYGDWSNMPLVEDFSLDDKKIGNELRKVRNNLAHGIDPWVNARSKEQVEGWKHNKNSLLNIHFFLMQMHELSLLQELGYSGLCRLRDAKGGREHSFQSRRARMKQRPPPPL